MVNVTLIDRKSNALTTSSLRCLSQFPTLNMTAGCIHGCAYCYIRGYSQYPGDEAVVVYRNTTEQVERELKRKRQRPLAVYFCPSSDAFMPVDEVLQQSYQTMRLLLSEGVGVQFVTKGAIPDRFIDLFAQHPQLVAGQVGLTTFDERLNAALEPQAAPAARRLAELGRLVKIGVTASLRADPLIHGVTDDEANLSPLFEAAAEQGIRDISASYLFLRPAIVGSLRRSIRDPDLLQRILAPFEKTPRLAIRGAPSGGVSLPKAVRQAGLEQARVVADRHGLKLRICGCKNTDLTSTRCHLTNLTTTARAAKAVAEQPKLW
ncbi:MAG: radical SAM protein [Phycisphaeraceae bacterium]